MRKIIIIGASGHGKVVADIALQYYDKIEYLDDNPAANVLGPISDYYKYINEYDFFVAIGDNTTRKKVTEKLVGVNIATLIHKNAVISNDVNIGKGTVVMAGVVINPGVTIGEHCIINTCSSVDHDCVIGNYTHVSIGAHIAGTVHIGDSCFVAAGTTIINNVSICNSVIIGAGSTVIKDIDNPGTYVGTPVRKVK